MKKTLNHLILAFIVVTQVGCSVRVLNFDEKSNISREYDFFSVEKDGQIEVE